jgi:hypothetical protein
VEEAHSTCWVDENIPTELGGVGARGLGAPTSREFFGVCPPRARSPDIPDLALKHPVRVIQASRVIDEHEPMDSRLLDVSSRE